MHCSRKDVELRSNALCLLHMVTLVPKLQLGNPDDEALASRDGSWSGNTMMKFIAHHRVAAPPLAP